MPFVKECGCRSCELERVLAAARGEHRGALDVQVGGKHYKGMKIQPIEYAFANNLGFVEANVVKYVTRWRVKGGVEDLRKARHYLDLLIEHETRDLKDPLAP